MGQVLLLCFVVVFISRWLEARFPAAPAKPKTPKPPRLYKRWERWWMGLGSIAITALWLWQTFFNPRVSLLESLLFAGFMAVPVVLGTYHALTPMPQVTQRQWWIVGLSALVLYAIYFALAPTDALPVLFLALLLFGLADPGMAMSSDAKGKAKQQALTAQLSIHSKASPEPAEAPMLVPE